LSDQRPDNWHAADLRKDWSAEDPGGIRLDLTDAEWSIIAPLLPGAEGKKNGRPRPDDRKVINGIFFVLRTGTPWRDLPERYGHPTVYNRFNR